MSRKVLIIRHAASTGTRHDRHQFPKEGAPLSEQGYRDAKNLKPLLLELGIDLKNEPAAISELIRTRQTAGSAGLKNLKEYSLLNEVESGLPPQELDTMIEAKQVPAKALEAADKLLANPPNERIWVTHGMLIAAIASRLGIDASEFYIPSMASITELEIQSFFC